VLIGVENIGALRVQETGDSGDNSFAVGAMNQEYGGIRHLSYTNPPNLLARPRGPIRGKKVHFCGFKTGYW
jgi:hypothetical protein